MRLVLTAFGCGETTTVVAQANPYSPPGSPAPGVLPDNDPRWSYVPLGWRTVLAAASVLGTTLMDTAMSATEVALGDIKELVAKHDVAMAILSLSFFGGIVLSISSWVFVPIWMHRASANLRGLGRYGMEFSPGWCAGWFFVPFAQFVKPPEAMTEIWRASDPNQSEGAWTKAPGTPLVGVWWGTWLVSGAMTWVGAVAKAPGMGLAGCGVRAVAAVCLLLLLRGVASRQAQAAGTVSSTIGSSRESSSAAVR